MKSQWFSYSFASVYDISGAGSDRNCVVLNDIHIDIMDYIVPASCDDTEFRQMWAEFEWENKVAVNTNVSDLAEFLQHVIKITNMRCLTPEKVRFEFNYSCRYMLSFCNEQRRILTFKEIRIQRLSNDNYF